VTRYPIVLLHGINSSGVEGTTNITGFYRVREALERDGHEVHAFSVPPFNSVAVRAGLTLAQIELVVTEWERRHPGMRGRVNVIAHSMGGLDARAAIQLDAPRAARSYRPNWIASLTTISTPHRGSGVADWVLDLLPDDPRDPVDRMRLSQIDSVISWFSSAYSSVSEHTHVRAALVDLSLAHAPTFNAAHRPTGAVFVQTFAGVSTAGSRDRGPRDLAECRNRMLTGVDVVDRQSVLVSAGASHVGPDAPPNDGMVSVASARGPDDVPRPRWVFRGCIAADHLDEVGQPHHDGPDPDTGFDHVRFYRNVAFDLVDLGF
jgi:triacylglycerol lipase